MSRIWLSADTKKLISIEHLEANVLALLQNASLKHNDSSYLAGFKGSNVADLSAHVQLSMSCFPSYIFCTMQNGQWKPLFTTNQSLEDGKGLYP